MLWFLEEPLFGSPRSVSLRVFPAVVGRSSESDVQFASKAISWRHAEFFRADGELWLRDLGSTNGTAINSNRIDQATRLKSGDVVRFGDRELQLKRRQPQSESAIESTTPLQKPWLTNCARRFRGVLEKRTICPYRQPIVSLTDRRTNGHEMLAVGRAHDGSLMTAVELFEWAEIFECERELGATCRTALVEWLLRNERSGSADFVSLNIHPAELADVAELLRCLEPLRTSAPALSLVVEVQDGAAIDRNILTTLRRELRLLDMRLAYDNFGRTTSELATVADVPPDYLKFDREFLSNISRTYGRQRRIRHLITTTKMLGVEPIALGIETEEEAARCVDLGFDLGQGNLFGASAPASSAE